ncbi:MAG TPA: peptidylprolyl isomerase [Gemmataceae bacterium]|jgi:parvulin-like peptidyl-prolyl isomerase|nr:peptidylprolyl isomerase [Gemmataceae bacterium]
MRRFPVVVAALLAGTSVLRAQPLLGPPPGAILTRELAARVNGEPIKLIDVQAVLDQRPVPVRLSPDQERAHRRAALDMLIDDALMRQYLNRSVQTPPNHEIDRVVMEFAEALRKQNKTLDQYLRQEKQTDAQLRADVVTELQWKAFLAARYSENEARAYFEANRPYFEKVQVQASHILMRVSPTASPSEREKARMNMTNLRNLILNRQISFEEAARKYSDCPSKERGGDLGRFAYKFVVVDSFARAAFATPVGDISEVVATEFGLHLIKVTGRTPADPADFDSMKDLVRRTMAQEQGLYAGILQEQKRSAKVEVLMQ